jgi:alpha-galactosidase
LELKTLGKGLFAFKFSGRIENAAEALFIIDLEKDFFRNRYVPYYSPLNRERCPQAPTGWMSWNTYFDKATAEDNLAEARTGKKFLQPFGCEFWSIESWQGNSDQLPVRDFYNMDLEVNEKQFPKGMKQLADDIRALGFRPGLWMAPFGTGNRDFYESHRDWFLHDKQGNPISCWNGRFTLDPTVQEARDHLKEIFRTASREWGYEFFKIDGMSGRSHSYCAHLYERPEIKACFRDPDCPNPFELCVRAFREGMGEDRVFLACQGHTSGAEALYADASRIGADIVHPNQPVKWSNVLNQGRCTINQVFTHNIVMINDPDTLLVRDLPLEEARVTTTVVALPGQLTFFGDKLAGLPADRMKMLQQTLPAAHVMPLNLYPVFSMLPVWNLHINNELTGNYNVVALFNWDDEDGKISFTPSELGVDQDAEYT